MRTMLGGVVVVLGLGLLGLLVACGQRCTLRGCTDVLVLEVRSPDGGLVETFRGAVTLDGQESTFECPSTGDRARDCVNAGTIELDLSWIDRTDRSRPIGRPAMALPVTVTALDGGLSWSRTITPTTWFANGEACGPECIRHVERLVLEPR